MTRDEPPSRRQGCTGTLEKTEMTKDNPGFIQNLNPRDRETKILGR